MVDRRRRKRLFVLLALPPLCLAAACGTRESDSQIASAAQGRAVFGNGNGSTGGASGAGGTTSTGAGSTGSGTAPGFGTTGVAGGSTSATSGGTTGGTSSGTTGSTGTATGTSGSGTGGAGTTSRGGSSSASGPCTSQGAPIVIGQDGSFSGLVGQAAGNMKLGMSVWAKWVNANGGLQCHPVQLYQEDDGSDPSKTSSNINDLVQNKHAVALVGTDVPIVVAAAQSTARKLGVPLVGGDVGAVDWYQDPNSFPSGAYALSVYGGGANQAIRDTKKNKIGLLYCVEASTCGVIHDNFTKMVAPAHGQVVLQQSMSLTQSSYTTECANAQKAGVQVLFIAADASTLQRVARSCKSINYQPVYVGIGLGASPSALYDPNIQAAGLYVGVSAAPFISTDTPALQTFHAAMKQYSGSDAPDEASMSGWTAGMLFKAAIDALGAKARSGPITTAMVYEGLYKLKNETLGGLIPPMNYVKGQAPKTSSCFSTVKATKGGLQAPTGSKLVC